MKIKDVLQRDPATYPLVNQGQARIADKTNEKVLEELKGELSTFVCEGQFADGIQKILSSYLTCLNQPSQKAAWVSGFFGSGKSHFLKMLTHLWQDTEFPDGSTARSLVPHIPDEVKNLLRELDTVGKRAGGLLAAAGSLPSGAMENVRLTVLGVLFRAVGLPEQYAQAQFCLWLREQGFYSRVKASVEATGKSWEGELNNLYVSGPMARAVLESDSKFASSEVEARKVIREQYPTRSADITSAEFLAAAKRAFKLIGRDGRPPCTVLVLDEVQQYIADSNERSTLVTEVVEAVSKQLDSYVIVVGAGQSALTEVPLLHKLMDRFTIRVPLSDADVETVTRKVLLQKKPAAIGEVRALLESHAGEISRQLQGTRISESAEDRRTKVDDYPLLPVRRRFWESCFRQVDAAGTSSQLRSQLRIIHDAVARVSNSELGTVLPGDELYEALAPDMVNTGVLLRELNERIINLSKDGTPEGKLARRVCGVAFLIGRLPRQEGADIGVRATKEHIADLLVDDVTVDNGSLRSKVESTLEKLALEGVLMRLGNEFRLQTKEGSEWDREYRVRYAKLNANDADLQLRRDGLLYADADRIVRTLKVTQGAAKESRQLSIYRDQNPPPATGESIPLWIRDGWAAAEKDVLDAARTSGTDSPVIYVFIPRQSSEDLKRYVIEAAAAEETLNARGIPTTLEGTEARQGMQSRHDLAVQQRDGLIKQIVANAKVFQGGGSEQLQLTLEEKLRDATGASLIRLFPRYKEADAPAANWEAVIKRARAGDDQPLQPVGYGGSVEQHPVCQQVLATIGAGKNGSEIRKVLKASPFGWPQDAIDAALIALHRSQHVTAMLNGSPIALGQLDQNKLAKAEFRVEQAILSVSDRLAIRKLFSQISISCKSGEEALKASEFLTALVSLADGAGSVPPMPARPSTVEIEDLKKLVSNEQLVAIRDNASELEKRIEEWGKAKSLAEQRKPAWGILERMARHSGEVSGSSDLIAQVEAIRTQRLLLEPNNPVASLRAALAAKLREAVGNAFLAQEQAYKKAVQELSANETWLRVPEKERERILGFVSLASPQKTDVSTDESLLNSLDGQSVSSRLAEVDAIAGRVPRALEAAAKFLEPKVRTISVERSTLRTEADVKGWLERQEKVLVEAVKQGPILIS
jgi:hypothetical protein